MRRDPFFQDALSLRDAMNRLFEESFVPGANFQRGRQGFAPAIDLSETENAYLVEAAVPGLKAEDLNINVENNVLTISGEIKQEQESNERNYHRVERTFGSFQRTMTLPNTVKVDDIKATLKDGVLHLEIPKAEEVKPRRIQINVNNT
jgi:HSP20 family protein